MSSNFSQSGNQSNLEELSDAELVTINGGNIYYLGVQDGVPPDQAVGFFDPKTGETLPVDNYTVGILKHALEL